MNRGLGLTSDQVWVNHIASTHLGFYLGLSVLLQVSLELGMTHGLTALALGRPRQEDLDKFQTKLEYIVSSRPAWSTQQNISNEESHCHGCLYICLCFQLSELEQCKEYFPTSVSLACKEGALISYD